MPFALPSSAILTAHVSNDEILPTSTHSSTSAVSKKRLNFLSQITSRLKNIDGIDETAASLALIRGLTGPIAAESVFLLGFPFVVFGLMGMFEESAEARAALSDLVQERTEIKTELLGLLHEDQKNSLAGRAHRVKLQRFKQHITDHLESLPAADAEAKVVRCISVLAQLKGLQDEYKQTLMNRMAAPFGQAAMVGMTAGMLPGMTWGAAEIAARALDNASLPAQISSIAGAGVSLAFAPANAAMTVYAAFKATAGAQRAKQLKKLSQKVKHHLGDHPLESRTQLIQQYIQAEHKTNRHTQSLYGMVTGLSQTALSTSGALSIATFFGVSAASIGATAGALIPVLGAAGAIGAAGMRIRGEMAAENRRGDADLPRPLIKKERQSTHLNQTHRRSGQSLVEKASDEMMDAHQELAKHKLLSLAMHAIKRSDSPAGRLKLLDQWVFEMAGRRGRLWGQGTTLLPETVRAMRQEYACPDARDAIKTALMKTDKGAAAGVLIQALGLDNPKAFVESLDQLGLAEEVIDKFDHQVATSFAAPLQLKSEHAQTKARQTVAKLLRHAFESHTQTEERIKDFQKRIKANTHSYRAHLSFELKAQMLEATRTLLEKENFTDSSQLEWLMRCNNLNQFERQAALFGLPKSSDHRADTLERLTQRPKFKWITNRIQEISAPKLIDRYKNSSKVALNQAFLSLQKAALFAEQENALLNQLNEV